MNAQHDVGPARAFVTLKSPAAIAATPRFSWITLAELPRLYPVKRRVETVCRGGTISIIGVYGGTADPINMLQLFDKGVKLAMGQAHVKRWIDDLMPLVLDDSDPLGVEDLCTHRLPLEDAPHGYEIFKEKEDGAVKIVLQP